MNRMGKIMCHYFNDEWMKCLYNISHSLHLTQTFLYFKLIFIIINNPYCQCLWDMISSNREKNFNWTGVRRSLKRNIATLTFFIRTIHKWRHTSRGRGGIYVVIYKSRSYSIYIQTVTCPNIHWGRVMLLMKQALYPQATMAG